MRRAFALVPLLLLPSRAGASLLVEDARATGHLLADDDLLVDRGWWAAPLDGSAFGVSTAFTAARVVSLDGVTTRWGFELVLQIPFERILDRSARRSSSEDRMKRRHWGAMAALPGAIAIAGAAKGKAKESVPPALSSAPSTSATIVTSAAPSVAGVVAVTAPLTHAPLPPNAIRALIAAAHRHAGVDRDDALTDLAARARASALAPELRLRALRGIDNGARLYREGEVADRATVSDGVQTIFEARLSWRLDRLVFADEEIAIERIRVERLELKQRISAKVIDLVVRYQRARRAAADVDLPAGERDDAAVTAVECLLALDALTGGVATSVLLPTP